MLNFDEQFYYSHIILRPEPFVSVSEYYVKDVFEQMIIEIIVFDDDFENVDDFVLAHF